MAAEGVRQRKRLRPIIYLLAIPAALLLIDRVGHLVPIGDLLTRAARVWRELTHEAWSWCFSWLHLEIAANYADMLSLSVISLGAGLSSRVEVDVTENNWWRLTFLAFASTLVLLAIFAYPYLILSELRAFAFAWAVPLNVATGLYNRYKPERWTGAPHYPNLVVIWWCLFMILIFALMFAPNRSGSSGIWETWILPFGSMGIFFACFLLLQNRNPLATTRILVVLLAIYFADRVAALIAPTIPLVENWIGSVEAREPPK